VFIQEQLHWQQVSDERLSFLKTIGVDYLAIYPAPDMRDGADRADYWRAMKRLAESHGLQLRNTASPGWDEISLGLPDRDEKIEAWRTLLRNLGAAAIPTLGYNFKPAGNFRTTPTPGRGGARYSTFEYGEFMQNPPYYPDKAIPEERLWENLAYFLERVIPVAEEVGVRMALHPDDPPLPEALGGVPRIVSTLEQYRRIFSLVPSDCNAMLFCQGCVTEMGVDVEAAIREMGALNKLVYVHFRNVRGTPRNFQEVFIDEGDVDMVRMMETYRDVGFHGPFMMDHTPEFAQPEIGWWAGRAYAVGYMRALIQAVYR
jgi:mannonate dehydratase